MGVMLQSRGIMVVGFAPVMTGAGEKNYPARDSGVEIGDLIMKVDGKNVTSENDLAQMIDSHSDDNLTLTIKRQQHYISLPVKAIPCKETGRKRIGLFVRDGIMGVGTLSFWDPESNAFAALGHIIIDADTRQGVDVLQGKIVSASIQTVKPGKPGQPGEKIGIFNSSGPIEGKIEKNSYSGLFGETTREVNNPLLKYPLEVPMHIRLRKGGHKSTQLSMVMI